MLANDRHWLGQTLELARRGRALASPNPMVGAVVVDGGGCKIGEGFYTYDGRKHAEILALEEAGEAARGGTVYVSLEPCGVHGRTPPCADALAAAGVVRVVAASRDENPEVNGAGYERLRAAGVETVEADGEIAAEARRLNEAFFHYARTGKPLVTLKAAVTLDGKIAAPDDNTGWITSAAARAHVQQMRHDHDAILTGIGTVQADDCLLTDRTGLPRRRPLLRIVADSLLRLSVDSRIVQSAADDLLIATTSAARQGRRGFFESLNIPMETFDAPEGRVDLPALVERLGARRIVSLMIEAGSKLNWGALESGVVDKLLLYYAPKILGGLDSLPMVGGAGRRTREGALLLENLKILPVAENEFAVEAYVVKPPAPAA